MNPLYFFIFISLTPVLFSIVMLGVFCFMAFLFGRSGSEWDEFYRE